MPTPHRRRPSAPIPGTQPPPRGLFIDRWGTLLELPEQGFVPFCDVRFAPGALDALFRLGSAGWNFYLIGNEDGVARGRVRDAEWSSFERSLLEHLAGLGIRIQHNYACLEDPHKGVAPHRRNSVFRLPDTGIFFHAQQQDGLQLRHSYVIGDSTLELTAGVRAGCRTIGVATGLACRDAEFDVEPHARVESLTEALELFQHSEMYSVRV